MPSMRQMDVNTHPACLTAIAIAMVTWVHTTPIIMLVPPGLIGQDIAPQNLIWTSCEVPSGNSFEIGPKRYPQYFFLDSIGFANNNQGKPERDACYLPMTNALLENFSGVPLKERSVLESYKCLPLQNFQCVHRCNLRVLVPGSGLARLALDVAKLGKLVPQFTFLSFSIA